MYFFKFVFIWFIYCFEELFFKNKDFYFVLCSLLVGMFVNGLCGGLLFFFWLIVCRELYLFFVRFVDKFIGIEILFE